MRRPVRRHRERDPEHRDRSGLRPRARMDSIALGLPALVALIAIALFFDFLNGFHDAANSIATVVSTRVLPPNIAVLWAAFFNFVAFLVFGVHVATTLGTGIIDANVMDPQVV